MYSRRPANWAPRFGGIGGPIPRDLLILLAVLFVTFSLQFLAPLAVAYLRLTPLVWRLGFVWQALTYPFIGYGPASIWILLELFILYLFGKDVFWRLGRKNFWQLLAWGALSAALVAIGTGVLMSLAIENPAPFAVIMQGQRILLALLVAAFATLYGEATIYLFFVLPVQARWFIPLEILFAFIAFLGTGDLAGFLGISAGVAVTYSLLTPGGLRRFRHELSLRLRRLWYRLRLSWLESKNRRRRGGGRGGDGGNGDDGKVRKGPWVN